MGLFSIEMKNLLSVKATTLLHIKLTGMKVPLGKMLLSLKISFKEKIQSLTFYPVFISVFSLLVVSLWFIELNL